MRVTHRMFISAGVTSTHHRRRQMEVGVLVPQFLVLYSWRTLQSRGRLRPLALEMLAKLMYAVLRDVWSHQSQKNPDVSAGLPIHCILGHTAQ